MIPEWVPPRGLRDPYVRRLNVMRTVWSRAIRGRIDKLADVAVARTLADYGNKDGTNCHPGIARLALDLCSSEKTVMRSLGSLWEAGWITHTERGSRKLGQADTYRLTIPAPVAVELGLWVGFKPDQDTRQWMERPPGIPKRQGSTGHRRPLEQATSTGHRRPLEPVSSGHFEVSRGQNDPFLGDTGVPPPGSTRGSITTPIGSIGPALPRRGAHPAADIDPDDPDLIEAIEAVVEEQLGGPPHTTTYTLITNLAEKGAHPRMVVNAALAHERDGVIG